MSWDVLFQKMPANFQNLSEIPEDHVSEPLCARPFYEETVTSLFPDIDAGDPSWMVLERPGFSIEFNAGDDDPMESVLLHVRGGGPEALDAVHALCRRTGWKAIDTSTGTWIDFEGDPDEGFAQWRAFRDKACGTQAPPAGVTLSVTPDAGPADGREYVVSVDRDGALSTLRKGFDLRAIFLGFWFVRSEIGEAPGFVAALLTVAVAYGLFLKLGVPGAVAGVAALNLLVGATAWPLKLAVLRATSTHHLVVRGTDEEDATLRADRMLRR